MAQNIFKMEDINRAFTNKVAEYIAKGMTISTDSMRGHQGELCKVDFKDGDDVVRVLLYTDYMDVDDRTTECTAISIRKYTSWDSWSTLWNDRGEELERISFWKLRGEKYVDCLDVKREAIAKHRARRDARRKSVWTKLDIPAEKVLGIVRRHKGYRRIKAEDIYEVLRFNGNGGARYHITFRNGKDAVVIG